MVHYVTVYQVIRQFAMFAGMSQDELLDRALSSIV